MASSSIPLPPPEQLRAIAARQEEAARENLRRRRAEAQIGTGTEHGGAGGGTDEEDGRQADAARLIQRNYRGYRSRREMRGHGLSSGRRWEEAVKTAQYRNVTSVRARREDGTGGEGEKEKEKEERGGGEGQQVGERKSSARQAWRRAGAIAQQAASDDTSSSSGGDEGLEGGDLEARQAKRRAKKREREAYAKTMGLEYFLEMVDQKHRYGSSLRAYHRVWQEADTKENFFSWLDYGEGKEVELEDRPRERLEREQIRYLSREERGRYQVDIGEDGLFRWAKNGELITTSPEWKDSVDGIVPAGDKTPTWRETQEGKTEASSTEEEDDDDDDDSVSGLSTGSREDDQRYVNQEFRDAKGVSKLKHVNTSALMNSLLRKTTKKNTWIFVADTSFRVYLGIKQSGAFQHSSFLHGARVSAAGLIRIKRGQLRRLDPLSGHYAPPAATFRGFVHSLKEAGADMSRVSISRSYAVLLGLEAYVGAKKRVGMGEQKVKDLVHPEEKRKREEGRMDKSKSAEMERRVIEEQKKHEAGHTEGIYRTVAQKLHLGHEGKS
ncbi:IQ domain-containing protein IQM5 [Sphaceloma murrayae]|uniref:IQ domain-containing protein IQM5 n=1 Tax=Sphaceloma murrayae TaxID=2082308 RepID=A0A2K1QZA5_9PEZI|nr:IQ domain-containing protein IQM5 [Sphaceloma murrayae]